MQRNYNYTDAELVAMPRVNIKLLDEVLDHIIEHPDQWDQRYWAEENPDSSCGTTFCFAGHAAYLSNLVTIDQAGIPMLNADEGWFATGRDLLGLTDDEAFDLFENTLIVYDEGSRDEAILRNVKVEVERIRARAKAQDEAFNRLAQEFIDAAGLEDVVKPGYECPESTEVMQGITSGAKD